MRLYPAGVSIVGSVFVGDAADTSNELSTWSAVSPAALDVASNARSTATVTIAVPRDAALGERYGVVWAEVRAGAADSTGVTNVSRVGIRLYISVGPGGAPAADFAIESLTAARSADGVPSITATVHNTGGRALDISGSLQLEGGPAGLRAGPFPATLGTTLAIDAAERVRIALDEALPAGSWDATITLRSGSTERTAYASIVVPAIGSSAPVGPTPPPQPGSSYLLEWCAVGALLTATAIGLALRRRHSRHAPQRVGLIATTPRPATYLNMPAKSVRDPAKIA